jgi:hypothetical protein
MVEASMAGELVPACFQVQMVPCSISSNKKLRRQSVSVTWVSNAIALHAEPQYNATTPGGQPQSGVALAWTPWGGDS